MEIDGINQINLCCGTNLLPADNYEWDIFKYRKLSNISRTKS